MTRGARTISSWLRSGLRMKRRFWMACSRLPRSAYSSSIQVSMPSCSDRSAGPSQGRGLRPQRGTGTRNILWSRQASVRALTRQLLWTGFHVQRAGHPLWSPDTCSASHDHRAETSRTPAQIHNRALARRCTCKARQLQTQARQTLPDLRPPPLPAAPPLRGPQ